MADLVSLQDLKDWGGYTDTDDDVTLQVALTAASRAVEAWCDRAFASDTVASARTYHADESWTLEVDDFSTITGLIIKTDSGDNGTFDQTWTITQDFVCYPLNGVVSGQSGWPFCTIQATGSRYFPISGIGSGLRPRVQVTALWGWAAVPAAVTQAVLLKAARLARRKDMPESSGGFDASGFHMPLVKVSTREDPDVCMLLAPYRKMTRGGGVLI